MLKLIIQIAKKVQGNSDYSSIQASVTIERELAHGEDVLGAAAVLQAQAEASVDRQLGLAPVAPVATTPPAPVHAGSSANMGTRAGPAPRPPTGSRRAPTRATPSQLGLLQRLIGDNQPQVVAICQHHRVQQLSDLSVAQASEVIDTLKAPR